MGFNPDFDSGTDEIKKKLSDLANQVNHQSGLCRALELAYSMGRESMQRELRIERAAIHKLLEEREKKANETTDK